MRWQFESLLGQARWPPVRVAACLLAVAVAFVARLALVPWLGHEMAYVTFYPAVMVVATLAGFWLGVAATLVSTVLATTFVPGASFERPETHDAIALVAFVVTGLGVSLLAALYRRARSRLSELERRAALHDSEEVFRAFFHNAAVGTVQLDLDGRFLAVNDRYCEITGYSREELLAMTSLDLAPQEDRASRLQELQLLRQCGSRRFEAERRYVRKDGRVVWVRATGGVMRDIAGVPARIAGLVEDVTERREAEAARGRSELEFRTLADNIAQLAWMADEQGRVTWYSKRWYEYTGATPAEMEDDVWTRVVHADHLPRVLETARGHMARGEAYEDTFLMRGSDGQYRWFLTRVVPVRDDSGRVVRWLGTSTDVTEQRDRELALRETDRRKNEFLAVLSHELRNPLAPIRSSLYVLDHSVRADQAQRAREIIERQVRHMTRLIDDLLDISRIARGKVRLSRERFDLAALVRRTAEDRAEVFARNGIAFAVSIGERPVFVDGDPTRIAQVVDNLLQNAVKFTPRGGHVSLELATDALGQAVLRVRDDGVGIAPEAVDRVFQPFVQAYGTVGRSQGGLGLGLALVRGIVELHDGTVSVSSPGPGLGAEFVVRLATRPPEAVATAAAKPAPATLGRRVLLIDDDRDAVESLKEALELDANEVEVALDGTEGIEKARHFAPDVVVCDISLPRMDGYEVARRMREDPQLRSVGLVALTGHALDEDVERCRAAGFDRHVAKPPDPRALQETISELRRDPRAQQAPPPPGRAAR